MFSNFVCPQGQDISDVRSLQRGQVGENLARCKQQAFRDKHGGGHGADVEKNEWMIIVTRVLFNTSPKNQIYDFWWFIQKAVLWTKEWGLQQCMKSTVCSHFRLDFGCATLHEAMLPSAKTYSKEREAAQEEDDTLASTWVPEMMLV